MSVGEHVDDSRAQEGEEKSILTKVSTCYLGFTRRAQAQRSDTVAVRSLGCARPARHPGLAATASSCPRAQTAWPVLVPQRHRCRSFGAAHRFGKRLHQPDASAYRGGRTARISRDVGAGQPRLLRAVRLPGDVRRHPPRRDGTHLFRGRRMFTVAPRPGPPLATITVPP